MNLPVFTNITAMLGIVLAVENGAEERKRRRVAVEIEVMEARRKMLEYISLRSRAGSALFNAVAFKRRFRLSHDLFEKVLAVCFLDDRVEETLSVFRSFTDIPATQVGAISSRRADEWVY